jgi:hypothetical protein
MTRSAVAALVLLFLAGCGQKANDVKNALSAAQAVSSGAIEEGLADAEKLQKERVANGDTLAIPYEELQKFLPTDVSGYTSSGEPEGSSQSMPGFSMSQVRQRWAGTAAADGSTPEVEVTLVDFGGTQQGYAMMAAPMMMGIRQEDSHRKVGSVKVDIPHTGGWEEFNKDNKDAKFTAVTRYRYVITVEARNQGEDRSSMVKSMAEEIARKFEGK